MADNIHTLPETYGPMLREFYAKLLQEPLPPELQVLVAMIGAASAAHVDIEPGADVNLQAVPHELQPDSSE